MTDEHVHDWRVDPTISFTSYPPQNRIVCAACGKTGYQVVSGPSYSREPLDWPKAVGMPDVIFGGSSVGLNFGYRP